jgi:hypothetical protein
MCLSAMRNDESMTVLVKNLLTVHFQFDLLTLETTNRDASCMLRYFLSGFQMGYDMGLVGGTIKAFLQF